MLRRGAHVPPPQRLPHPRRSHTTPAVRLGAARRFGLSAVRHALPEPDGVAQTSRPQGERQVPLPLLRSSLVLLGLCVQAFLAVEWWFFGYPSSVACKSRKVGRRKSLRALLGEYGSEISSDDTRAAEWCSARRLRSARELLDVLTKDVSLSARRCPSPPSQTWSSVLQRLDARAARAVSAAEDLAVSLYSVSNDAAAAVGTLWRERLDRTFEAVERMLRVADHDVESLVVVVAAQIADRHERTTSRDCPNANASAR